MFDSTACFYKYVISLLFLVAHYIALITYT